MNDPTSNNTPASTTRSGFSWKRIVRLAIQFAVPIAIFWIIFKKIEWAVLFENAGRARLSVLLCAFNVLILTVPVAALRLRYLAQRLRQRTMPFGEFCRMFWMTYAFGLFFPSQVGGDAVRVVYLGRRFGSLAAGFAIIFSERLVVLSNLLLLLGISFPMIFPLLTSHPDWLATLPWIVYGGTGVLLTVLILMTGFSNHPRMARMIDRLEWVFNRARSRLMKSLGKAETPSENSDHFRSSLKTLFQPGMLVMMLLYTLAVQAVAAFGNNLFFMALGYDIPVMVNLFFNLIAIIVFMLPISFGGFGIREGTFIVFYGLFGVPAEIALLISFFNLIGILLNSAIGGGTLLLFGNPLEIEKDLSGGPSKRK